MPKPTFFNLPNDKRQRIIDAAIEEFGARPYGQATLDRIVEAAGVSKGSMYQYFGGKADLYGWLLTSFLAEKKLAFLGRGGPSADAPIWVVLEHLFLAGVRFATAEPGLTRLGARFYRDHEQEAELAAIWDQSRGLADVHMRALFEAARERGEVRADVSIEVLTGLVSHALGEGMLDVLARHLGVTVNGLLARPEALAGLTDDELRAMVAGVTDLFRNGAG